MVEITSLAKCDRTEVLALMQDRWSFFYEPFAPPAETLDMLACSPQAFIAAHEGKPMALFWYDHDKSRPPIFPLLHFFPLKSPPDIKREIGIALDEAWLAIIAFTFSDQVQAQAVAVSGYRGQIIHHWLSRQPLGKVYWIPKSRLDPRTFQITDYWEFIIHSDEWESFQKPQ